MRKGSKMSEISRQKMSEHRKTMVGELSANWKGGVQVKNGRIYIQLPKKRILRYRWIMENHLGRKLSPDEIVHHINGDKTDDRIENLLITDRKNHALLHTRKHTDKTKDKISKIKIEWWKKRKGEIK